MSHPFKTKTFRVYLTMSLQNEEAFIKSGKIILSANIRGMVRDEGCFNGLSYI